MTTSFPANTLDFWLSSQKNKVAVFASTSRKELNSEYTLEAMSLGKMLAQKNYSLILGGTKVGLLGKVFEEANSQKAQVFVGLIKEEWRRNNLPTNIYQYVFRHPEERLSFFIHHADAFIALPGGFGTIQEIITVIVNKQLKLIPKDIPLLLHASYAHVHSLCELIVEQNFAHHEVNEYFQTFSNIQHCIEILDNVVKKYEN